MAEYERALISERTKAGLKAARARGRKGGRPFRMTKAKLKTAQILMRDKSLTIPQICKELDISPTSLYRYVSKDGEFQPPAEKILKK